MTTGYVIADGKGTAGQVLQSNGPGAATTWVNAPSDVFAYPTQGSFPSPGTAAKVYIDQSSNTIYNWSSTTTPIPATPTAPATPSIAAWNFTVGSGGDFPDLPTAIANASVTNGMTLKVLNGTYTLTSQLAVNKQLVIFGESVAGVILQSQGTSSDPAQLINVSVDNVALINMTIKHRKTTNTSVEAAISASGPGFPQTRIANFIIDGCRIEYAEFGVVVRGSGWKIANCTLAYSTGAVGNSNRAVGVYGVLGNCFFQNNVIDNTALSGTATRGVYLTGSTGSNPNESVSGALILDGTSQLGTLQQFFLQDNLSGSAASFSLYVTNNVINETSVFCVIFCVTANAGDIFTQIIATGNTSSGTDGGTPVGTKGTVGIDGSGAFRSSALTIYGQNNTMTNTTFRTDWTSVSGTLLGRANTVTAFAANVFPVTTAQYVQLVTQSGITGSRPSTPVTGQMYFDTTLNRPIWWTGSSWILADGTVV